MENNARIQDLWEQDEDTQKDKYLIFFLGKEFYGIEIKYVIEIIGIQTITEVPGLPHYLKGIINLRGKIIPVMDVRERFKKVCKEYNERTCVIVIEINHLFVGLIVDQVAEVLSIPEEEIVPPPEVTDSENKFIKGIGKVGDEVKLLINCEKLLINEEIMEIKEISK
ncbi:MAG: chemotaxis protein CheW [Clostridia bacterium]|nr:chemotaxis protein CheW [Clostridia bacterium]MDD4145755.1 chemotaxis protein CheW [Clostridia bacterium]MDD4665396.1 chemotaxis protein CheW [Clostridia bacterium]